MLFFCLSRFRSVICASIVSQRVHALPASDVRPGCAVKDHFLFLELLNIHNNYYSYYLLPGNMSQDRRFTVIWEYLSKALM
jgi:hypothetical protein